MKLLRQAWIRVSRMHVLWRVSYGAGGRDARSIRSTTRVYKRDVCVLSKLRGRRVAAGQANRTARLPAPSIP
jgi:hypothetical protein